MRLSAQSLFHSFDPLGMNVTHHVDAMLFAAPGAECPHLKAVTQAEQVWANDEQFSCAYRRAMNALIDHRDALARGAERAPVGEATLLSSRFVMHEQAMTLKLTSRWCRRDEWRCAATSPTATSTAPTSTSSATSTTAECRRRDPPPAQHRLRVHGVAVPRRPPRDGAVVRELPDAAGAVVGGVFTVFGLVDGALYNGIKAVKQD